MRLRAIIVCILIVVGCTTVVSQPCLPDGITFTTQSQIDSFPVLYPSCTEIEGDVWIAGSGISDLSSLDVLTAIGGDLIINANSSLPSLLGLNNLKSIGGGLAIYHNPILQNLTGLDNLSTIGGYIDIGFNYELQTLTGLESLTTLGGDFRIGYQSINTFTGLENLNSIGGDLRIRYTSEADSLTGFEGLNSVGGGIYIAYTDLISLTGIDNIEPETIEELLVHYNFELTHCAIESICSYLADPAGNYYIWANNSGCNSPEEVKDSCEVNSMTIEDLHFKKSISAYPNPFTTSTTISFTLDGRSKIQISIFNSIGEEVYRVEEQNMPPGRHSITPLLHHLPQGMYFAVVRSGDGVSVVKMVKE